MTDSELADQRRHKWHLDGRPVRSLEDAQEFIDSVGFCLMYPEKRLAKVPTFLGAWAGNDGHLPTLQYAFEDDRAHAATNLMVRLLRERSAFEANLFGENAFLVSSSVFPYFYGLVGDRNPRQVPKAKPRGEYSLLARDAFEVIRQHGAINKSNLRDALGQGPSPQALDHALGELWSRLRITRVDHKPGDGAYWDTLFSWAPDMVRAGIEVSIPEALSALVCKYLDCVIAAEEGEITEFFSHFVARSKINDAVSALLSARELAFVPVGNGSKIQMALPKSSQPSALSRQRRRPS